MNLLEKTDRFIGPLARTCVRVFSTKAIIYIVGFFLSVYVARMLGAAEKGRYAVFSSIVAFVVQFEYLGMSSAVVYYTSKDKNNAEKCYASILLLSFCALLLNTILFFFFSFFGLTFGLGKYLLFISFLTGTLQLLYMFITNFYIGINRISTVNSIELCNSLLLLSLVLVYGTITKSLSSNSMAFMSLANLLIVLSVAFFLLKIHINIHVEKFFLVRLLKYGLKSYLACLACALVLKVDIFMLKSFLPDEQVGIYSLAANLSELFYTVSSSVALVAFPKFSSLTKFNEKQAYMKKLLYGMFFISVPILLLLGFTAPFFIHLCYGNEYFESVSPFRILLPGIFFWSYFNYLTIFFSSENKFIHTIWVPFALTVINIVMNRYLIPRSGINGAAIASSITYFAGFIMLAFCYIIYCNGRKKHA